MLASCMAQKWPFPLAERPAFTKQSFKLRLCRIELRQPGPRVLQTTIIFFINSSIVYPYNGSQIS